MTSFHSQPLDIVSEIFVAGDWHPVTIRHEQGGAHITRGRLREGVAIPDYSSCVMTLDNLDRNLSPGNPLGDYYGDLKSNTPFRLRRIVDRDRFDVTTSNDWPDSLAGVGFTNTGSAGVAAGDFNAAGGVATQEIDAANAYRLSYMPDALYQNVDVVVSCRLSISNITGAPVSLGVVLRGQSTSEYVQMLAEITTSETINQVQANAANTELATTAAGPAYTGQWLRMRVQVEEQTYRMRVWDPAAEGEPYYWDTHLIDVPEVGSGPQIFEPGFLGFIVRTDTGNTNGTFNAEWKDLEISSPRVANEIPEFPVRWDTSGTDCYVPTSADGILRRLGKGGQLQSALRQELPKAAGLVAYWPCEDDTDSTILAPALPGMEPMGFSSAPAFASFSGFDASLPIPTVNLGRWVGQVPYYTETGEVSTRFLLHIPDAGITDGAILHQTYTSGTAMNWEIVYGTGGTVTLKVYDNTNALISTNGPYSFNLNGKLVRFCLDLQQTGSDVHWIISAPEVGATNAGFNQGDVTSKTLGRAKDVRFTVGNILNDVAIGHVTVQNILSSVFDVLQPLKAYAGERAGRRLRRLLEQAGVTFTYVGQLDTTVLMGPQRPAKLLDLVKECVETDLGTIYESRFAFELVYVTRRALYGQAETFELDMSLGQINDPFEPNNNDDTTVNYVTVNNVAGSSAVAIQETGPKNIADPPDGIGIYDQPYSVNVHLESQLPDVAGWLKALGTVNEERYPALGINLANRRVSADHDLSRRILDLDIDHRIMFVNATNRDIYDPVSQLVRGWTEKITQDLHEITAITVPEKPYQVTVLDDTEPARYGSATSFLENAISSSATEFTVARADPTQWTETAGHFPFNIRINGEEMTVSNITTVTPTFVAAGTAVAADNASVTPGLPAGATQGDLLVTFAASRGLANTLSTASSGWSVLWNLGCVVFFWKVHGVSESAGPTIDIGGTHAAGDTVQAQMIAIRNCPQLTRALEQQFNSSAQNIAFPSMYAYMQKAFLIYAGWKQDDWTSVATLTGATEIGEPSSTLGSDQGIVWDYKANTGVIASPADSFVVTGGTSQNSRGMVLAFGNWQKFTVTRGVNGFSVAHAAGSAVDVAKPFIPGL